MNDLKESGINYTETDLCPTSTTTTTTTEEPFGNSDWVCAYLNSDSNFYRLFLMRLMHYFFCQTTVMYSREQKHVLISDMSWLLTLPRT